MRTIDYSRYEQQRPAFVRRRAELGAQRAPGRRPRDDTERALLRRLDAQRWQRWLAEGKLKKLGPRAYRLA
jgi:hypothetical protein